MMHTVGSLRRTSCIMVTRRGLRSSSKSSKTPIVETLERRIRVTGPITVADYMRECLTHPQHGYYMKKDVFGSKGDFITSPEISQMFGELLGVWVVAEWQALASDGHLHLIEFGPGRGTLAADMLRTISQFDFMKEKISLHLLDVSPKMIALQHLLLCGRELPPNSRTESPEATRSIFGDIDVSWHRSLGEIEMKGKCCVIAHEFLDALPIHKFQKSKEGEFHEVLIDNAEDYDPHHFREVLTPSPNANCKMFANPRDEREHVEVSPLSGIIVQEIANTINKYGGFALLVDYGHDGTKEDTFRSFKSHKINNPLQDPGEADLTADVDFAFLRHCLRPLNVVTNGPISQQVFLHNMGIRVRLRALLSQAKTETQTKDILSSYRMLCSPDEMGDRFKFFSIHAKGHSGLPAGFTQPS
ncbi:protein arginine methyltransferase NDUFAF7, mitochondrial-like [Watersipora subatra]|uniref:protein arginine methyltransferase NDUFAF7, mitochondrial-like n=1 Tax=Watersipora subatra TaxID=2589382 RepID=UPI00355C7E7C